MNLRKHGCAIALAISLIGCAGIDRDSGKALGNAGVTAARAIADLSDSARHTIDALPEMQGVHDALSCSVVKVAIQRECLDNVQSRPIDGQPALSEVMAKRATAAAALANAYQSFVDLATYDAGGEAQTAITHALASVNDLAGAVSKYAPTMPAIELTSAFTGTVGKITGFTAAARQEKELLAASQALHKADVAMIQALTVERDKLATESLLGVLQDERDKLYTSFVDAGLIAPEDALQSLLSDIAPGASVAKVPDSEASVVRRAAEISLAAKSRRQQAAVRASYDAALGALQALAVEHQNLEAKQPLNLKTIISQAKRMQGISADLSQK
jgi:hypothetical protein